MAIPVALESVVVPSVENDPLSFPQRAHTRPPDRSEPASEIALQEMLDEPGLRQRQTHGQPASTPPAHEEGSTNSSGSLTLTSSEDSQLSKGDLRREATYLSIMMLDVY